MPVMRVFYTFYIHSSFHLCNSFIRVIRDFNIRGMTINCSTSSVTGQNINKILSKQIVLGASWFSNFGSCTPVNFGLPAA